MYNNVQYDGSGSGSATPTPEVLTPPQEAQEQSVGFTILAVIVSMISTLIIILMSLYILQFFYNRHYSQRNESQESTPSDNVAAGNDATVTSERQEVHPDCNDITSSTFIITKNLSDSPKQPTEVSINMPPTEHTFSDSLV